MKLYFNKKTGLVIYANHEFAKARSEEYMRKQGFKMLKTKKGTQLSADKYYIFRKYHEKKQEWEFAAVSNNGLKKAENMIVDGWELIRGIGLPIGEEYIAKLETVNLLEQIISQKNN